MANNNRHSWDENAFDAVQASSLFASGYRMPGISLDQSLWQGSL
jgi:hypothetical protein